MVEPPAGPTGPVGIPRPVTRAPHAWAGMIHALHSELPEALRESARTRRRMRALRHRRRRIR